MQLINYHEISGWAVTSQSTNQVIITDSGQVITGTNVYFATGEGNNGAVFVPDQHYSVKNVHDSIEAKAKLIDQVGRLVRGGIG